MISSVATLNLQQASGFGFVERQQIGEFQKLTALFEKAAIGAQSPPEPEKDGTIQAINRPVQS